MRIQTDEGIFTVKSFHINKTDKGIKIEYWENYYEADKEGGIDFLLDKSCFKNGEQAFDLFIKIVKRDMLEKGFFDFEQDYDKLISKETAKVLKPKPAS